MTHVITAPHIDDPRENGFVHTIPGELVIPYAGFLCDSGDTCGCSRAWTGVASRAGTTIAAVNDHPISRAVYINLTASALTTAGWDEGDAATATAGWLAFTAADVPVGTLLVITIDDSGYEINKLEARPL